MAFVGGNQVNTEHRAIMSQLSTRISAGQFAITAELVPRLAGGATALLEEGEHLRGLVDAINVTDGAGIQHKGDISGVTVLSTGRYSNHRLR